MPPTSKAKTGDGKGEIERVRRICLSLPETWEKISHGEPTWFVGKKVFAMFSNNHHGDGHIAVTVPAAIGIQEMLIEKSPKKFYRPPYVGVRGWVGIEVARVSDKELTQHLSEAWRLIATPKIRAVHDPDLKGQQIGSGSKSQYRQRKWIRKYSWLFGVAS